MAVIATIAAALRFETLGQTSLAHFDEGVLASGAFGVWLNGPFHFNLAQPLQAPPLFPWLVAAAHQLALTDWVIMGKMVAAFFATATVPLVFLLARRVQGNLFGLVAAALLAASDLHVAYARMALTDAPLTFWFTLSMYCLFRLFEATIADDKWRLIGWTLAAGLATGAAWNTKYNGWMPLAAAFSTLAWIGLRDRFWRAAPCMPGALQPGLRRAGLACLAAAIVAGVCFLPWYLFVDRSFAGGYRAVTENHLSYFGGPAEWPGRAWQLAVSLSAFRHYGWLLNLIGAAVLFAACAIRAGRGSRRADARRFHRLIVPSVLVLAGLFAALTLGADLTLILLGAAAIVPALVFGRWEHVLFAVWLGAFVVMTPLYHPYTRLLAPAIPAAICLALWLADAGWGLVRCAAPVPSKSRQDSPAASPADSVALVRSARLAAISAVLSALAIFSASHPFGMIPSAALWRRWSTRESYRSFGLAIDRSTPADAVVLCQGLPAMALYCPREWRPLDFLPFTELLSRVSADVPCYLAVDEWGAHGEGHGEALAALLDNRHCLHKVASATNDLNIVALLDNLSPWEVAAKLSGAPAANAAAQAGEKADFFPPALREMGEDVIVLYRVDRACVDSQAAQ
ncbi:MAG TPA: phospholipid carrier-dependent glycosyltransferase [Pirellulales bacterium]|nr:phospholipid carrier-dependent glycosyltransferase [Pirellulales bacterium]